ncbi:hypothetical protein HZS92_01201 [Xanthomonas citri pv. citri]|nr:hypothetical protein HZS92_01201 [Xanthomonas citri pv. citri]QYF43917.1 hypothetical protein HZS93_01202 [Xanthomonas citri]CEE19630.1 hypothetical protein XAC3824_200023 [Xanthomonas citri pv. citri]CEL36536.1 hypothetical protein XAC4311_560022 [Xanthomonas citri pv. citri]
MTDAMPVAHPAPVPGIRIAVLVPCHNEAATVAAVVGNFSAALPGAVIHVLDNNSSDATAAIAAAAGAQVCRVALQGKATWYGVDLPMSRPTSTCWSMATPPTMPPPRRRWCASWSTSAWTWWSVRGAISSRPRIGRGIGWATSC